MLMCFAAPSMHSHLCSHRTSPCCHLSWLGLESGVLFLEGWSASSSFSVLSQCPQQGIFPHLCFWLTWSYVMELFHLNCLPLVIGWILMGANTDPSLFSFLEILMKYKEETAFLLKRRDHGLVLSGLYWCWYWGATCSCHTFSIKWSGLMTLKLGASSTTEELRLLFFPPAFYL